MSSFALAGLVALLMLVLLFLRVPVAYSLLIAGITGLVGLRSFDFAITASATQMFDATASWSLVVIPLFVAMGVFARHGTLATDGFAISRRVLRRVPGGLPMATVLAAAGFAAINGSSVATVAAIGPVSIREMRKAGYSAAFSAGVIGSSGTLGVLIPPSIFLVLYGIVAGVSIGQILIAGIVPGIVTAIVFLIAIYVRARFAPDTVMEKVAQISPEVRDALEERTYADQPDGAHAATTPDGGTVSVLAPARPVATLAPSPASAITTTVEREPTTRDFVLTTLKMVSLVLVVIGGIYTGILTVIEAAAFGMLLTIVYFIFDQRTRLRVENGGRLGKVFRAAVGEIVELNAMMFALVIGATVFTFFLVLANVPQSVASSVLAMNIDGKVVVLMFLLLLIPLGMFLDSISLLLVSVPLMYPVVDELGFSGIWFGILVVKMIELGLITPPIGLNAFVVAGVSKVPVAHVFKGLLWFVPIDLFLIGLFFLFPSIVTWLPTFMG